MTLVTAARMVFVVQGTSYVSAHPEATLSTVLGSCISVCLFDPVAAVGQFRNPIKALCYGLIFLLH